MKKRNRKIAAALGIVIIGGIWYNGAQSSKALPSEQASPTSSFTPLPSPSDEPSQSPESPSPSASQAPDKSPKPSASASNPPTAKPTETKPTESTPPTEAVKPPVKESAAFELLADSLPGSTVRKNKQGLAVITNASSLYVLVNKQRNLASDYVPKDLIVPDVPFSFSGDSPKKQMRKAAAKALESLFKAAKDDGIKLKAVSGYRSYATQKSIFDSNVKRKGEKVANRTSARPGQSEHQTGLAMDISSASVGYALEESFGKTKEGQWLAKHAAEHGFIIRYLKGKESVTGYSYEPWHVRFVGKEIAEDIANKKVTLEQYFEDAETAMARKA
ncbi:M15 family metallopeptidase [Cohnella boryungensis]|uniref:D-alanyl-D-alanine carboxypeptidase family protein n=1 Tax=Cohnella boryungensis TaxID=768479 RepID=A0ABV8SBB0_9BACL